MNQATSHTEWRILAIDDDQLVHETYRSILTTTDPEDDVDQLLDMMIGDPEQPDEEEESPTLLLDHAYSGVEGFEMVRTAIAADAPYAVILLDMRMPPGWDGLETAEEIRTIDQDVRIVIVTAYMDYSLKEIRNRIGINFEFIGKPAKSAELLQLTLSLASNWSRFRQFSGMSGVESEETTLELRQSRTDLSSLKQTIDHHAMVCEFTPDGIITRVNDHFCTVSGYARNELVNHPHQQLLPPPAARSPVINQRWRRRAQGSSI